MGAGGGFDNRVLRKLLGSKRDGVTGGQRKLRKGERHDFDLPPDINRVIIMGDGIGGSWNTRERRQICADY